MLKSVFKAISAGKPELRELSPSVIQRIKEGAFLVKFISESEVATRKCEFFAANADDAEVSGLFKEEAAMLRKFSHSLQEYYEAITKE